MLLETVSSKISKTFTIRRTYNSWVAVDTFYGPQVYTTFVLSRLCSSKRPYHKKKHVFFTGRRVVLKFSGRNASETAFTRPTQTNAYTVKYLSVNTVMPERCFTIVYNRILLQSKSGALRSLRPQKHMLVS